MQTGRAAEDACRRRRSQDGEPRCPSPVWSLGKARLDCHRPPARHPPNPTAEQRQARCRSAMTLVCAGPIPDDTRRHMSRSPHRPAPIHAVLSGWDEGLLPPPVRSLLPAKGQAMEDPAHPRVIVLTEQRAWPQAGVRSPGFGPAPRSYVWAGPSARGSAVHHTAQWFYAPSWLTGPRRTGR